MADKKKEKEKDAKNDAKEEKPAAEGAEGATEGEGEGKKKSKKMIIIIAVAAVLVLGGVAAALFFTGVIGGKPKPAAEAGADGHGAAEADAGHGESAASEEGHKAEAKGGGGGHGGKEGESAFFDLGEIVVNLSADGRRQTILQLVVQLELENVEDKPALESLKPRIVDNFQTYMRELRIDDLRGSKGLYRLREELLFRVTEAVYPIKVKDVLFQRMLMQ